jgi:hypothetical protein
MRFKAVPVTGTMKHVPAVIAFLSSGCEDLGTFPVQGGDVAEVNLSLVICPPVYPAGCDVCAMTGK